MLVSGKVEDQYALLAFGKQWADKRFEFGMVSEPSGLVSPSKPPPR
ncbi:hypothetical protein [Pseudomonas gelidaquae]|nr:hypothetical protein [Pseudomonas sp. IB20]